MPFRLTARLAACLTPLALLATPVTAGAQTQAAPPDVAGALVYPGRAEADAALDSSRQPVAVLNFLGLERGDDVLDIMAGLGYYTEIIGHAVGPEGSVMAYNLPQFVSSDRARERWNGVIDRTGNVFLQSAQVPQAQWGNAQYDFALLHLVYHDAYWESEQFKFERIDPAAMLAKLYTAMKPGGIVGVVDHVADPGGDTRAVVDALHRIDPEVVKRDFAAAGFVLEGESDVLSVPEDHSKNVFDPDIRARTDRFVFKFRKPVTPPSPVTNTGG